MGRFLHHDKIRCFFTFLTDLLINRVSKIHHWTICSEFVKRRLIQRGFNLRGSNCMIGQKSKSKHEVNASVVAV